MLGCIAGRGEEDQEAVLKQGNPTVSVIVPSYNQGEYIESALRSILQQTYLDYEIIAVDDGSTDGSVALIGRLRTANPERLRVLTRAAGVNEGIVKTYSRGFRACRGRYIAFVEADDCWSPDYLAQKIQAFEQYPEVGVVFSRCKVVPDGLYGREMALRQSVVYRALPRNRPFSNFRHLLRHNNVATFSAFAVRASSLRALFMPGDAFMLGDARLPMCDWWILLHLSLRTKFYFESQSFTRWRQLSTSFMGRQSCATHRDKLMESQDVVYDGLERTRHALDAEARLLCDTGRKKLPLFQAFYRRPSVASFVELLRADPMWAMEALASYLVNSLIVPKCVASAQCGPRRVVS